VVVTLDLRSRGPSVRRTRCGPARCGRIRLRLGCVRCQILPGSAQGRPRTIEYLGGGRATHNLKVDRAIRDPERRRHRTDLHRHGRSNCGVKLEARPVAPFSAGSARSGTVFGSGERRRGCGSARVHRPSMDRPAARSLHGCKESRLFAGRARSLPRTCVLPDLRALDLQRASRDAGHHSNRRGIR
jgi:hypothetical protein